MKIGCKLVDQPIQFSKRFTYCLIFIFCLSVSNFSFPKISKKFDFILSSNVKVDDSSFSKNQKRVDSGVKISELNNRIYLHIKSRAIIAKGVFSYWYKLENSKDKQGKRIFSKSVLLAAGAGESVELKAPANGFSPGRYKVVLKYGGTEQYDLFFEITKAYDSALLNKIIKHKPSFNIAMDKLGGKILSYTSEYDKERWAAKNLIDGKPYYAVWKSNRDCVSCGWSSKSNSKYPQEIIFAFYKDRSAHIDMIQIDTRTWETITKLNGLPKHIEVWVSNTLNGEFRKHAKARLHNIAQNQTIQFKDVRARRLKIRILSKYSRRYVQIGEIKIFEVNSQKSTILHDYKINLAYPRLGGHLIRFSSQDMDNKAVELFDGKVGRRQGWVSAKNYKHKASYLPQDFVLGFKSSRLVNVRSLIINSLSGPRKSFGLSRYKHWPKKIAIYISKTSAFDSFRELKVVSLAKKSTNQEIEINTQLRFLKIRILENYGAAYTSLGELKVIEARVDGSLSALFEFQKSRFKNRQKEKKEIKSTQEAENIELEKEPNNSISQAKQTLTSRVIKGRLDPLTESDYYRIIVPGKKPSSLSLDIKSKPFISTSFSLLKKPYELAIKKFDPSRKTSSQIHLSWYVDPGKYFLKIKSEPASLVLAWDTSGSMKGRRGHLSEAVEQFIKNIKIDEEVQLIRFSNQKVEVLLNQFTSDQAKLLKAIQGKIVASGGTPLYDAIKKAIELLVPKKGNRAIILLSDGGDSESISSHQEIIELLAKNKIRVYVIGLGLELDRFLPEFVSSGKKILYYFAKLSNGMAYFTPKSKDLSVIYNRIASRIRQIPTYYINAAISNIHGSLIIKETGERIPSVSAPARIEFILDASGSMKRKFRGQKMITIAKKVLKNLVTKLPVDVSIALRVYGHRIKERSKGDCKDSQLVVPFSKNKKKLLQKVMQIKALGTTPIAYSLAQIPSDLDKLKGHSLVILITDGKEECKGFPAKVIKKIRANRSNIKLNVVGFNLKQVLIQKQMLALAKAGGGKFYNARNAVALEQLITKAMSVSFDVFDESGTIVAAGALNRKKVTLPSGIYNLVVYRKGKELLIHNVRIKEGKTTEVQLKKEGQEIGVKVITPK